MDDPSALLYIADLTTALTAKRSLVIAHSEVQQISQEDRSRAELHIKSAILVIYSTSCKILNQKCIWVLNVAASKRVL